MLLPGQGGSERPDHRALWLQDPKEGPLEEKGRPWLPSLSPLRFTHIHAILLNHATITLTGWNKADSHFVFWKSNTAFSCLFVTFFSDVYQRMPSRVVSLRDSTWQNTSCQTLFNFEFCHMVFCLMDCIKSSCWQAYRNSVCPPGVYRSSDPQGRWVLPYSSFKSYLAHGCIHSIGAGLHSCQKSMPVWHKVSVLGIPWERQAGRHKDIWTSKSIYL